MSQPVRTKGPVDPGMPHLPVSVALKAGGEHRARGRTDDHIDQSWGEAAMKVGSAAPTRTPLKPTSRMRSTVSSYSSRYAVSVATMAPTAAPMVVAQRPNHRTRSHGAAKNRAPVIGFSMRKTWLVPLETVHSENSAELGHAWSSDQRQRNSCGKRSSARPLPGRSAESP